MTAVFCDVEEASNNNVSCKRFTEIERRNPPIITSFHHNAILYCDVAKASHNINVMSVNYDVALAPNMIR